MSVPTFVHVEDIETSTDETHSVTRDTNALEGDLIVVAAWSSFADGAECAEVVTSGYSLEIEETATSGSNSFRTRLYIKQATSSDTSVTLEASSRIRAKVMVYRDVAYPPSISALTIQNDGDFSTIANSDNPQADRESLALRFYTYRAGDTAPNDIGLPVSLTAVGQTLWDYNPGAAGSETVPADTSFNRSADVLRGTGGPAPTTMSWSMTQTVPNVPPDAPNLLSPVGTTIDRTVTNRFDWAFSDPDTGDTQSEFQLQIRLQGETATAVDVTSETITTHYDLPGGTLAAGDYEWRVRTRDALGEQGPYSSWEPFTADEPPAGPTITSPVNEGTIGTEQFDVTWSASEQDAYQLRRLGDAAGSPDTDNVLFDTGQVNSSGARSRTVEFPTNDQTEHVQVRVLRNSLWSPYSTVRVHVDYTVPETPTAVLAANTPQGAITVSADNPTPGSGVPTVESFRVFRRRAGDSGDGIRLAVDRPPSGSFVDWSVASGVDYQYRVQAMGDNGTSVFSAWSG